MAKRGDSNALTDDGSIDGLLIPASLSFSPNGKVLYVANLSLYLPPGTGCVTHPHLSGFFALRNSWFGSGHSLVEQRGLTASK